MHNRMSKQQHYCESDEEAEEDEHHHHHAHPHRHNFLLHLGAGVVQRILVFAPMALLAFVGLWLCWRFFWPICTLAVAVTIVLSIRWWTEVRFEHNLRDTQRLVRGLQTT